VTASWLGRRWCRRCWGPFRKGGRDDGDVAVFGELVGDGADPVAEAEDFVHDEDGHGLVLDLGVDDEALDFAGALIHDDDSVVARDLLRRSGDGGGVLASPVRAGGRGGARGGVSWGEGIQQGFLDFAKTHAMRFEVNRAWHFWLCSPPPAMTAYPWKKFILQSWLGMLILLSLLELASCARPRESAGGCRQKSVTCPGRARTTAVTWDFFSHERAQQRAMGEDSGALVLGAGRVWHL